MKWFVVLKAWNGHTPGTRVQMQEEDAKELVSNGVLHGPFPSQQEAVTWKPEGQAIDPNILLREERERVLAIRATGRALRMSEEQVDHCIANGYSLEQSKGYFADRLAEATPPVKAVAKGSAPSQHDKFAEIARDALTLKAFSGSLEAEYTAPDVFHFNASGDLVPMSRRWNWTEGRALRPEASQWAGRSLVQLASMSLEQMGIPNAQYLDRRTVAELALSTPITRPDLWSQHGYSNFLSADGVGFHTPSHFPNFLRDAVNKRGRAGFELAPTTYQIWTRQAPSVPDFKTIHRPIMSEDQDLDEITGAMERFPESKYRDHERTYRVARYGKRWSIQIETIINDDMNMVSLVPFRRMIGARSTLNRFIYNFLTSNPSVDTGNGAGNLFNNTAITTAGGHKNDLGTGAPSVAQLNLAWEQMMTQRALHPVAGSAGVLSDQLLNIGFRWLIAPAALRGTTLQLLRSTSNPATTSANTEDAARPGFNSGVSNIWQGGFELVVDANLDSNSNAIYYFAADPSLVDTVEYCFLSGFETPRIETEFDFETKGQKATIEWDFGAQVIDHRGLVRAGV